MKYNNTLIIVNINRIRGKCNRFLITEFKISWVAFGSTPTLILKKDKDPYIGFDKVRFNEILYSAISKIE